MHSQLLDTINADRNRKKYKEIKKINRLVIEYEWINTINNCEGSSITFCLQLNVI